MEEWLVYNKRADFNGNARKHGIDPVTARIIRNREIIEDEDIRKYLSGGIGDLYDPHLLKDGDKLCEILIQKIEEGKAVRIIGDYDIDGVMSSYILLTALERLGAKVSVAIPHRMTDGYGLNANLIQNAKSDGIDTILTCDNGIAAISEIALAKSYGMTVLVTDHHEVMFEETGGGKKYLESEADAIVNPHQITCNYPYKELCGAGVAWKIVCLLYEKKQIDFAEAEDLLEYVAFATVGDIVSLTDENRILVKEGLKRIHHSKNIGMRALIAKCGLEMDRLGSYHFGFVLGPCINAGGRLDTAQRSLELFRAKDVEEASRIAGELVALNEERKELTQKGVDLALATCEEKGYDKDLVIVLYLPTVHESIAGIIAGRVREVYHRPVFVLTDSEQGVKGSGRSIEAYPMYEKLSECKELLNKFGGHKMAAGLSLEAEKIEQFRQKINVNCKLSEKDLHETIHIDVPMPIDYPTINLLQEFELLAPFGKENERPVFADRDISIRRMWIIGKNRNVLRLDLISSNGKPVQGIYFGDIDAFLQYFSEKFSEEEVENCLHGRENELKMLAVYAPSINRYRDMESVQVEIRYYK